MDDGNFDVPIESRLRYAGRRWNSSNEVRVIAVQFVEAER
jgi:hypothetical protein